MSVLTPIVVRINNGVYQSLMLEFMAPNYPEDIFWIQVTIADKVTSVKMADLIAGVNHLVKLVREQQDGDQE